MFFITNDEKSSMKPEYTVTQSSSMTHPYKWSLAGILFEKNIFSTVNSFITDSEGHIILFDTITVKNGSKKWLNNFFSILYIFLIPCLFSSQSQLVITLKLSLSLFLCIVFKLQQPNK